MAKQDPRWQDVRGIQSGSMGVAYDRAGALFGQAMQAGQNILDDQVQRESASVMESILNAGSVEEVDAARAEGVDNKWADQAAVGAAGIEQKSKIADQEAATEQQSYDRNKDEQQFGLDAMRVQGDLALRSEKNQLDAQKSQNDMAYKWASLADKQAARDAEERQKMTEAYGQDRKDFADFTVGTWMTNNTSGLAATTTSRDEIVERSFKLSVGSGGSVPDVETFNSNADLTVQQLKEKDLFALAEAFASDLQRNPAPEELRAMQARVDAQWEPIAAAAKAEGYYDTVDGRNEIATLRNEKLKDFKRGGNRWTHRATHDKEFQSAMTTAQSALKPSQFAAFLKQLPAIEEELDRDRVATGMLLGVSGALIENLAEFPAAQQKIQTETDNLIRQQESTWNSKYRFRDADKGMSTLVQSAAQTEYQARMGKFIEEANKKATTAGGFTNQIQNELDRQRSVTRNFVADRYGLKEGEVGGPSTPRRNQTQPESLSGMQNYFGERAAESRRRAEELPAYLQSSKKKKNELPDYLKP